MVDLLIPGPEGKIEAKYSHNRDLQSPIALILHPDPTRGGTMNTKIVFRKLKLIFELEKFDGMCSDYIDNYNKEIQ